MNETTNNPQGTGEAMTVDSAADAINDLLNKSDPATDNASDDEVTTPEAEQLDADESEGENENDSEPDDETDEAGEPPQKFRFKVNGEEKEATLDELISKAQKGEDYTRKTQEVAEQRRAVDQQFTTLQQAETQAQQNLELAFSVLQARLPAPPDPSLIDTDPVSYLRQEQANKAATQELQNIVQQYQVSKQRSEQANLHQRQERMKESYPILMDKIPELKNPETARKWTDKFSSQMNDAYGISKDEVNAIEDHRYLLIAADAMKYRELQNKKPSVEKKLQAAPIMPSGNRKTTSEIKAKISAEGMRKLERTGRVDDAAALIKNLNL